jgi:hypothetical protein
VGRAAAVGQDLGAGAVSGLPPVLDVAEVMARYGLRDRRAARRLMDAAGGFLVAGRLVVRADDLAAWERARAADRRGPADVPKTAREAVRAPRRGRGGRPWRRDGGVTTARRPNVLVVIRPARGALQGPRIGGGPDERSPCPPRLARAG